MTTATAPATPEAAPPPPPDTSAAPPAEPQAAPAVPATPEGEGTHTPAGSAEGKPTEGAPADVVVTLPEGVVADTELLSAFVPLAKEVGLDSPKAQRLADLFHQHQTKQAEAFHAAIQKEHQDWKAAVASDKEIGGDNLKATLASAEKAMQRWATPGLRQFLDDTGLGNHPEMVRFVTRVGAQLREDSIAGATGGAGQAVNDEEARLRALYPNTPSLFPKES